MKRCCERSGAADPVDLRLALQDPAHSQAIIRDCWIAIIQEKTRLVLSETRMQRLEHKLWWADMDRRISAFERHQAA